MSLKTIFAYSANNPKEDNYRQKCTYQETIECPSCHFAIEPKPIAGFYVRGEGRLRGTVDMFLLSLCKRCNTVFMSKYSAFDRSSIAGGFDFSYAEYSIPYSPKTDVFPKEIHALSPNFVETYSQSESAESQQLLQICGVGYRKALEYLVKDYLCQKYPEDAEKIRTEFLGASIKRIEDNKIKILAERSTWIGNDETHYVKKHEDLDINNMKRFIRAILTYIESELAFEEAMGIPKL